MKIINDLRYSSQVRQKHKIILSHHKVGIITWQTNCTKIVTIAGQGAAPRATAEE